MLSVLFTWIIVLTYSYIFGRFTLSLLGFDRHMDRKWVDIYIFSGICVINLYAQFVSLFMGVGAVAFWVLTALFCVAILVLYKKEKLICFSLDDLKKVDTIRWIMIVLSIGAVLLWTSIVPQHYDTYLYHAQAIHWIENYGVVKGLGNLHFRFAYNSAFMPLQALFSFKWLLGQSLHTINGFVTMILMSYLALTIGKEETPRLKTLKSDILKLGMMLYVLYDSFHVSSPNTDTLALLLIYYILVKWIEFTENNIDNEELYGFLCVLIVYATTLKLSVGIMVILVIYPAALLIKRKNILCIVKCILAGVTIIIPFIIRNVIISGYLLYPYKVTGISLLDWKMPESVLDSDMAEIIAWARGNMDVTRNGEHIWQWFFQWYLSINILWKGLMVLSLFAIVYIVINVIREGKAIRGALVCMYASCILGLIFWLLTAPLPRYGTIYMITLPCLATAIVLEKINKNKLVNVLLGRLSACFLCTIIAYIGIFGLYSVVKDLGMPRVIMQGDYDNRETITEIVEGYTFSLPVSGDQTGYEPFPAAPFSAKNRVSMRGESIKDGFR